MLGTGTTENGVLRVEEEDCFAAELTLGGAMDAAAPWVLLAVEARAPRLCVSTRAPPTAASRWLHAVHAALQRPLAHARAVAADPLGFLHRALGYAVRKVQLRALVAEAQQLAADAAAAGTVRLRKTGPQQWSLFYWCTELPNGGASNGNNNTNGNGNNNSNGGSNRGLVGLWFERGTPPCVQLFVDAWGVPRLRHVPAVDDPRTGRPLCLWLDAQHGLRVALAQARRAAQHARLRSFLRTVLARAPAPYARGVGGARPRLCMLPTGAPVATLPLYGGGAAVLGASELTGEITVDTHLPGTDAVDRDHAKGADTLGTLLRHAALDTLARHARAAGLVPLLTEPPAFMPRSCSTRPWAFTFNVDRHFAVSALAIIPLVSFPFLHSGNRLLFTCVYVRVHTEPVPRSGTCSAVFQSSSSTFVSFVLSFNSLCFHNLSWRHTGRRQGDAQGDEVLCDDTGAAAHPELVQRDCRTAHAERRPGSLCRRCSSSSSSSSTASSRPRGTHTSAVVPVHCVPPQKRRHDTNSSSWDVASLWHSCCTDVFLSSYSTLVCV